MSGIFSLFTVLFVGAFLAILAWNIQQWAHNNKQPILPQPAQVASKQRLTHFHDHGEGHSSEVQTYHITFTLSNETELDVAVAPSLYHEVSEGDSGTLFTQGTRFIDFVNEGANGV